MQTRARSWRTASSDACSGAGRSKGGGEEIETVSLRSRTSSGELMNWHLFTGFVLMTVILVLVPGPVVTLVISTGATRGVRAGLVTVGGTSSGNAVLVIAIAFGLNWVLGHALYL